MRIEIEDIVARSVDVVHLTDYLIRFRYASPLASPPYHRALLEDRGADDIFPGAPNRDGIREQLERERTRFVAGFDARLDDCDHRLPPDQAATARRARDTILARACVHEWRSLVRLNIEHYCRPDFLYTNGQALVTVVRRPHDLLEAVLHTDGQEALEFANEHGPWPLLDLNWLAQFVNLSALETQVRRHLAKLECSTLSLARGDERRTLLLQRAGTVRRDGRRFTTWLARLDGGESRLRQDRHEPARTFLRRIEFDGFRVRACATCRHGARSGMSNGTVAYCMLRHNATFDNQGLTMERVSDWDICDEHAFAEAGSAGGMD
jgi:hypothetical protein